MDKAEIGFGSEKSVDKKTGKKVIIPLVIFNWACQIGK